MLGIIPKKSGNNPKYFTNDKGDLKLPTKIVGITHRMVISVLWE